jgi:valyl-tRNA synthetase
MIETYGTDAVRMGLCSSATHAPQIDLDRRRFEEFKNFANKIWNGARFVFQNIEDLSSEAFSQGIDDSALFLEDRWILSLLNRTVRDVNQHLSLYAFDKAALTSYDFFWKEFCAYYLELAKPVLFGKSGSQLQRETKQKILITVLGAALRLLHPMAPFITEELFQILKAKFSYIAPAAGIDPYTQETLHAFAAKACIVAPYPQVICAEDIDPAIEETFAFLDQIVHAVRTIRADMQLSPQTPTDLIFLAPAAEPQRTLIESNQLIVQALVRTQGIVFTDAEQELPFSASTIVGNIKIIIPLPEAFKEKEKLRLVKEKEKLIQQQNQLRTQLSNAPFIEKAPPHVVEKLKVALTQSEAALSEVMQKLTFLS